jgi:hypothetical protein
MDMKPVKIGGELFWSNWMHQFNTKFNEENNKYECTLGNLSDKAVSALKELGIQIKNKDAMGNYIVGKSLYKFEPVDKDGKAVDVSKIGNGTKVTALVSSYRHKMSAKYGAAPSIKMLIVTELKEYEPPTVDDDEDEDDIL